MKFSLEKFLLIVIVILVLGLIAGTAILVVRKANVPEDKELISQGKAVNLAEPANTEDVAYYELDTLRIMTAAETDGERGALMVVTPWLAYPKSDSVFYEEIARKRGALKGFFSQYFSEQTKTKILSTGDTKRTEQLLEIINSNLTLGKISDLYFTDFLFLE